MSRVFLGTLAAGLALSAGFTPVSAVDGGPLRLTARQRVASPSDPAASVETSMTREHDPRKTAIVVCDMWDDHWCKAAAGRCAELAKKAEPVLAAARARGVTVVHAPSDCMAFYNNHPARVRMLAVKPVEPPAPKDHPVPPLPIDDKAGGCDDDPPSPFSKSWTRQHPALTIDPDRDYVSDSGKEVYSLLREKGITTLVVMGVHTNMCVLNRTFAIKGMTRWGVDCLLVRDLTDAMYDPKKAPFVSHAKGTELVIEHIERHWCPSIEAKQLAGGK